MNQDIALKIAVNEALALRRSNRPARVVVCTSDGDIQAQRCLCQEFGR
jgi:transketolase N-terminal domain/subunit